MVQFHGAARVARECKLTNGITQWPETATKKISLITVKTKEALASEETRAPAHLNDNQMHCYLRHLYYCIQSGVSIQSIKYQ